MCRWLSSWNPAARSTGRSRPRPLLRVEIHRVVRLQSPFPSGETPHLVPRDNPGMTLADRWRPPPSQELSTPEGRILRYCLYGPEDGRPAVVHDGTPGTRLRSRPAVDLLTRCGVRALVCDRPGYGGSTRLPGRSVADVVDDVARLADAQGWDRFATWGVSGGGPHALACAAMLPDRVTRCAAVVSIAPYAANGTDSHAGLDERSWFTCMSPGNVEEFTAALVGEEAYRPIVERLGREAVAQAELDEPPLPAGYGLPESDLVEMRRRFLEGGDGRLDRVRAAWLDGVDGWIDDAIAMTRPWGFDIARTRVPVTIWYGPDDVLSPRSHADWLIAHVPGAEARELPGGHMLSEEMLAQIIGWAVA